MLDIRTDMWYNGYMKKCEIENCSNVMGNRKLCEMHYGRLRRNGNPQIVLRNMGVGSSKEERLWSKIDIKTHNDCWEWTGVTKIFGYGNTSWNGKSTVAHKLAWFLTFGTWPNGLLLHSCDNPPCCNPNHLREGTHLDNMWDAIEKGRKFTTLSKNSVKEIKQLLSSGVPVKEIVNLYGVSQSAIYQIKSNKTWKHVE